MKARCEKAKVKFVLKLLEIGIKAGKNHIEGCKYLIEELNDGIEVTNERIMEVYDGLEEMLEIEREWKAKAEALENIEQIKVLPIVLKCGAITALGLGAYAVYKNNNFRTR